MVCFNYYYLWSYQRTCGRSIGNDKYSELLSFHTVCMHNFQFGIVVGIWLGRKYKHILTSMPGSDFAGIVLYLCMFFSALFLFLASALNNQISKEEIVVDSLVLYKFYKEAHGRSDEINYVMVNIRGEEHKLNCSYDYEIWARPRQKVVVNVYKSPLGFDFAKPADDN